MTQSQSVPARPRHGEHAMAAAAQPKKFVAALDVGTTTVRCHVLDQNAKVIGSATRQVSLLYPQPGYVEIDPDALWSKVVAVVKEAISDASLRASDVTCMGISTQRCTFITWSKTTGQHFHNLITWQDLRADQLVKRWDSSLTVKAMRAAARVVYWITRKRRFLAGSTLKLMNAQVTLRLLWVLQNIPALQDAQRKDDVMFGTFDTYLIYRLSGHRTYCTDPSSAAATGLFDPFTMEWAGWARNIFGLPSSLFPPVGESAGPCLATVAPDVWGAPIPICSSLADQSAAMFGACCFKEGDVKLTMGTGSFLNINTGRTPMGSTLGMYPLVGWKVGNDLTYLAESAANDTGTLVNWAVNCGLLKNPEESAQLCRSVHDSDGVYFVPAFGGLQAPINDSGAAAGFIGIKPSTRKEHMVRALLESIAFRVSQLVNLMHKEIPIPCTHIRVDGGVSKNDFVSQLIADLSGYRVERASTSEHSALGAAFLAGIAAGVWSGKEELIKLRRVEREFMPNPNSQRAYAPELERWEKAVQRFLAWHQI